MRVHGQAHRLEFRIMHSTDTTIFRGEILDFLADPAQVGDDHSYAYFSDGVLVVQDGLVKKLGPAQDLLPHLPAEATVVRHHDSTIVPGFVDCHVHYPQTEMVAAFGV
jgi:guanine deaminase